MDPAQEELARMLAEKPEEATPEIASTPAVEEMEYSLGGKSFKLPINAEFALSHNGKTVKAPFGTMVNHYRQRADLDGKFAELKKQREQWEQERGDIETYKSLRQKYEDIQKWSEANPEDWEHLYKLYQEKDKHLLSRDAGVPDQGQNRLIEEITNLKKQLSDLSQFKSSFEKEQQTKQQQADLEAVRGEVSAFKKEWPEINLDEANEDGLTLDKQIMVFGYEQGIPDFETAALKFLKPKLLDIAAARGRTEAVKGVKKESKQGIVAKSRTPFDGQSTAVDPRKMSWSELNKAAKAELESLG